MKNLLTSLRASNETYNSMKHSARAVIRRAEIPLLAVIVLYKAATNLLFVPLMQQLWSLTLRFAPMALPEQQQCFRYLFLPRDHPVHHAHCHPDRILGAV